MNINQGFNLHTGKCGKISDAETISNFIEIQKALGICLSPTPVKMGYKIQIGRDVKDVYGIAIDGIEGQLREWKIEGLESVVYEEVRKDLFQEFNQRSLRINTEKGSLLKGWIAYGLIKNKNTGKFKYTIFIVNKGSYDDLEYFKPLKNASNLSYAQFVGRPEIDYDEDRDIIVGVDVEFDSADAENAIFEMLINGEKIKVDFSLSENSQENRYTSSWRHHLNRQRTLISPIKSIDYIDDDFIASFSKDTTDSVSISIYKDDKETPVLANDGDGETFHRFTIPKELAGQDFEIRIEYGDHQYAYAVNTVKNTFNFQYKEAKHLYQVKENWALGLSVYQAGVRQAKDKITPVMEVVGDTVYFTPADRSLSQTSKLNQGTAHRVVKENNPTVQRRIRAIIHYTKTDK